MGIRLRGGSRVCYGGDHGQTFHHRLWTLIDYGGLNQAGLAGLIESPPSSGRNLPFASDANPKGELSREMDKIFNDVNKEDSQQKPVVDEKGGEGQLPPQMYNGDEYGIVDRVLSRRGTKKKFQCECKWRDHPSGQHYENTWESESYLKANFPNELQEFLNDLEERLAETKKETKVLFASSVPVCID